MKALLEHIVTSIVNNPDQVVIEEKESVDFPGLVILSITVAEDDKGVVIGRKGRTINAIRDLITINAIRTDKRVRVILDEGEDGERAPRETEPAPREEKPEENKEEADNKTVDEAADEMLEDEL